jgi:hypothetical protein
MQHDGMKVCTKLHKKRVQKTAKYIHVKKTCILRKTRFNED